MPLAELNYQEKYLDYVYFASVLHADRIFLILVDLLEYSFPTDTEAEQKRRTFSHTLSIPADTGRSTTSGFHTCQIR